MASAIRMIELRTARGSSVFINPAMLVALERNGPDQTSITTVGSDDFTYVVEGPVREVARDLGVTLVEKKNTRVVDRDI